jgi:hypothetical protein
MREEDKTIDPLPDSFETEEEAGAFWDAHSTMDYQEYLEPSDDTIDISESAKRTVANSPALQCWVRGQLNRVRETDG